MTGCGNAFERRAIEWVLLCQGMEKEGKEVKPFAKFIYGPYWAIKREGYVIAEMEFESPLNGWVE